MKTFAIMQFCPIKIVYKITGEFIKKESGKIMSYTWNSYPNIQYMGVLPCGISNFGGDTQVFTLDPDELGAATSPYLKLNPIANAMLSQRTMGSLMPQINLPSQAQIDAQAQQIANGIVNDINSGMLKQSLNVSTQNLASQKTKLNALLANPDLPDADKAEVNRLLNEIQEQERKINELSKKMAEMDSGAALKEAQEIENNIRKIIDSANKIKVPEAKQPEQAQPQAQTPEEPQGGAQNAPTAQTQQQQPVQNAPDAQAQQPSASAQAQPESQVEEQGAAQASGKITDEHRQVADLFHDAIAGLGTDDPTFNQLFDEGYINKDNIVEIMTAYEESYGTSFMDDFMDDADSGFFCAGGQKVKYGKAIARMLRSRAISAGVYNESKEDLQAINKEMDSTLYVSNGIYQNYDNVAALIAAKEDIA